MRVAARLSRASAACERVDAEAAHRIADRARRASRRCAQNTRDLRGRSGALAARWRRTPGCRAPDCVGLLARGGEEARDVVDVVLAVGVDLQRVGEAELASASRSPFFTAAPLPPFSARRTSVHGPPAARARSHAASRLGPAAVVDDDDVGHVRAHARDDLADGRRVVVGRDEHARAKTRSWPRLPAELSARAPTPKWRLPRAELEPATEKSKSTRSARLVRVILHVRARTDGARELHARHALEAPELGPLLAQDRQHDVVELRQGRQEVDPR